MIDLLKQEFGFESPELKKLDGYDNVNYLVSDQSSKYIFKTYPFDAGLLEIVNAENDVLLHLQHHRKDRYPCPIPFVNGQFVKTMQIDGKDAICRLLSYLDGEFVGNATVNKSIAASLGNVLAEMNLHLQPLNISAYRGREWEWDLPWQIKWEMRFQEDNKVVVQLHLQFRMQPKHIL